MAKLDAASKTVIREQCNRIHRAVNDGTLDRDTVNAALAELGKLAEDGVPQEQKAAPNPFPDTTPPAQPAPQG